MKKPIYIVLVALASTAAVTAFLVLSDGSHRPELKPGNSQELNAKIERLEQKIAALQRELSDIRARPPQTVFVTRERIAEGIGSVIPAVPAAALKPEVPPGWKPFEFNGLTYYLTPLGEIPRVALNSGK